MPDSPRPSVGPVPIYNATADDVQILGRDFATLVVGPAEFYMPNHGEGMGADRRRRQLEEIQRLGEAIAEAAGRSLTAMTPLPWAVA